MIEFVSRKERKVANARALKIVRELQKRLEPKYRIDPRLVGSARYNAVVCDDNGVYDMDYQLILTCNCKCFDADIVRKDFFVAFNAIKNANEKVENSTSVITVRVSDNSGKFTADNERFSFDFAIVMEDNAVSYITRRSQDNKYVWNRLPIVGCDISNENAIFNNYLRFENKYKEKFTVDELKSEIIKQNQIKHGFAGLNKLTVSLLTGYFEFMVENNIYL